MLAKVLEQLDALWAQRWPRTPPVGHLLRDLHRDRWVRFHSLPDSKRYPDSLEEYATILAITPSWASSA
jgi:hypothetical protein